jgi:hypothetical protein
MKDYIGQIIIGLLLTIVGLVGGYFFNEYQNRIKYLEYATYASKGIFNDIYRSFQTNPIRVSLDNKAIENISVFEVAIANLGNADITDVPVYMELSPERGQKLYIISTTYFDHNGSKEGVVPMDSLKPVFKEGQRFGFNINTFNRRKDFAGATHFTFLIEGDVTPKLTVQTNKTGVEIEEFKIEDHKFFQVETVFSILSFIGVILATISFFFSLGYQKSQAKKFADELKEVLRKNSALK